MTFYCGAECHALFCRAIFGNREEQRRDESFSSSSRKVNDRQATSLVAVYNEY